MYFDIIINAFSFFAQDKQKKTQQENQLKIIRYLKKQKQKNKAIQNKNESMKKKKKNTTN